MASFKEINLPQKPPMVMVDRIVEVIDKTTITAFLVKDDNIFCEDGLLREPGLIENIAQSAAAGIAANPADAGEEPKLGFIGAIRELKISRLPKSGDEIITSVTVTHEILNARVVDGKISLKGEQIAYCELRIFLESR
ncbi:MAG: 3-hydroxyacyl-ACP dehydratase [Bacteroidetes bacterium]|nr:3-hydroxyacyl-ACP dehydratase [Bacteroidota bacterium]